jgi:quinol-cytochrome oxidoreductase complex cytochrome b subunit
MTFTTGIRSFFAFHTYGWMAVAALLICALSGIALIVPYDVTTPYLSVTRLVATNPQANLFRNMHYWSAQLFLLLTIIHTLDHLWKGNETRILPKNRWFRVVLMIPVVSYVMLSGFILKADGDSLQAQRILASLLESLPFAGQALSLTLAGKENSLQIIYLQHAATASLILFILVLEHSGSMRVNIRTLLYTLAGIIALSFLLRAPLRLPGEAVMKGPWYFTGLQEILHYTHPIGLILPAAFVILLMLYLLPRANPRHSRILKALLLTLLLTYSFFTVRALFFRGEMWKWQWPGTSGYEKPELFTPEKIRLFSTDTAIPVILGHTETCMVCHQETKGMAPGHDPKFIGCYSCHGGDPFTTDKKLAHRSMSEVPGNLSNAGRACGGSGCHPGITERVEKSLMSSLSGMITVDRWVFGEETDLDRKTHIRTLGNSGADEHLRNLCAGCHLGNEKKHIGPAAWLERGGGCLTCHLTYNRDSETSLASIRNSRNSADGKIALTHPALNLEITDDHCKSCHSRSGRISMNYEGWHETERKASDVTDNPAYTVLPDGRAFFRKTEDVHHRIGMRCIDCHGSYELMGDDKLHAHKEEAVGIQCSDCHTRKAAQTLLLTSADPETQRIAWLRKIPTEGTRILSTQKNNFPLVNTLSEENGTRLSLIKKSDGRKSLMKPPAPACTEGKAHTRLSCEACHTAWAPQCLGCHTNYDPSANGFDWVLNKSVTGAWAEYSSEGQAELPVLGVNEKGSPGGRIIPFTPGMILTITPKSGGKAGDTLFRRLFAPTSAHTTVREVRSCVTCHSNPQALGYGQGKLALSSGIWTFESLYRKNRFDGLPEDAWTGFLKERTDQATTRKGMRPFTIREQERILSAGACLNCHEPGSKVMKNSLIDFDAQIRKMTKKCSTGFVKL